MTTTVGRYIGQSVKRREDPRLLTGRGRYVDDVQTPGTLHVAFVRSNVARGDITALDISEALRVPGVEAIYTGADLNPLCQQFWATMTGPPVAMGGQTPYPPGSVLAQDDVRYVGDPIAVVIASSRYVAEDAADLVVVDIEPRTPVLGLHEAVANSELVHRELDSNVTVAMPMPVIPEIEALFANAAHVITRMFRGARATNVPMEPRGLTVHYDRYRSEMEIRAATQSVHEIKSFAARLTGLAESHIRVVADDVGGGFGQKMMVMREEAAVIAAAFALGTAPVKWIEDRRENLMASNQARSEAGELTFAVDTEGHILAVKADFIEEIGAYPPSAGATAALAIGVFPGPYKIPVLIPGCTAVYTNTVGKSAYRGPWALETIFREQMMDLVAREIGMDPIELRRVNLIGPGDLPYTTATQMVYDAISPTETLDQVVEMIDVDAFRQEQASARSEGRLLGLGLAGYVEPSAIAFGVLNSDPAVLSMDISGKVQVRLGTGSHGHSIETTIAQVVATHLGCDIDDVVVIQGDTATSPVGPGTGGSRTAVIAGGAAQTASIELRDKLVRIAAQLLEANPDDLEVADSVVSVKGTPQAAIPFVQLAMTAHMAPDLLPEGMGPGLEVAVRYRPPSEFTWSNATHACIVEVDPETGLVDIRRYVVSEDCGQMINPLVVEGQIAGGVVQGIGGVLFENMAYDDAGNPLATTFMDYLIPSAPEIPDFEYGHVETMSKTLGGYKGMGEGGAIASPPALANAINDALAQRAVPALTEFPFGPSQIVAAITAAG
ncbi:MAG: xanthine dehydrogenase family protein molybdopterin-binding subunit [Acidimicrobiia bacterium]